jgi:hypothetical protein
VHLRADRPGDEPALPVDGHYSASGPNDYPSVRYTGRAASDPPGQLAQAEKVAFTGTGPQTEVEGRWGDYTTFFYTTEYLA